MRSIEQLTADDFVPYLGKVFRPAGGGPELRLANFDRRERPGWDAASRKPFALILCGPRQPVLPEGAHALEIEDGPTLQLYVIPIFTAAPDHQDYQIVFN